MKRVIQLLMLTGIVGAALLVFDSNVLSQELRVRNGGIEAEVVKSHGQEIGIYSARTLYVLISEADFNRTALTKLFEVFSQDYPRNTLIVYLFTERDFLLRMYESDLSPPPDVFSNDENQDIEAMRDVFIRYTPQTQGYFRAIYSRNTIRERYLYTPVKENSRLVAVTLNANTDWRKKGWGIFDAVNAGSLSIVEEMLKDGVPLNVRDELGQTPLIWSMVLHHNEIAEKLIEYKAGINYPNSVGERPLNFAINEKNLEGFNLLIKHSAEFEIRDNEERTPLMLAAFNCDLRFAKLLLDLGADTNLKDKNGMTAKNYACNELASFLGSN